MIVCTGAPHGGRSCVLQGEPGGGGRGAAPVAEAAARPGALADAGGGPVKMLLNGRADAFVKVDALIRARLRAGPPPGMSQAF
ncbi:hypothetical protein [Streptomyces sp. NPDC002825]|uniref:hypothetical protein n=1 Tax=Streptomyces sp. NPDC002825 TaxID=3154666 RepID=UPI00331EBCAD